MNNMTLAGLVITSPSAAFAELRERPRIVLPLLALIIGTALLLTVYYGLVDFDWLKDQMLSANPNADQMTPEQRSAAGRFMSKPFIMGASILSAVFFVPTMLVLEAAYYLVAGKITNVQQPFEKWLAMVCWASVPGILGALSGTVYLLSNGSGFQIGQGDLQLLSLNNLFFHFEPQQSGYYLLTTVNVLSMWSWALAAIGLRAYSNRSWTFCIVTVLLPFALIYGGLAWFAFGR